MASVVAGRRSRSGPAEGSRPSAIIDEAKSSACALLGTLPPYSSAWISSSAALVRPCAQAGHGERVRVGLLELVGGAVYGELAEMIELGRLLHPRGEGWSVGLVEERLHGIGEARASPIGSPGSHAGLEVALEGGPHGEEPDVVLPRRIDAVDPAIADLLQDEERDRLVICVRRFDPFQPPFGDGTDQRREQVVAQVSSCGGEARRTSGRQDRLVFHQSPGQRGATGRRPAAR